MFLASKAAWAGIVFILVTTGILKPPPDAARFGSQCQQRSAGGWESERCQEDEANSAGRRTLRGEVDGVSGLRTWASIRGFQKAENLPVTGQLDPQTAAKLGVRPEGRAESRYETTKGKPSAGIKWAKGSGRKSKTLREAVKTVAAPESGPGAHETTLQAENDNRP